MASEPVFRVNGRDYPVPNDYTLGEMADMERYFAVDFSNPGASRISMLVATLYIAVRRVDETVTVEEIRALPPDAFQKKGGDVSPPDAGSAPAPSGSSAPTSESSSSDSGGSDNGQEPTGDPTSATSTASVPETLLT